MRARPQRPGGRPAPPDAPGSGRAALPRALGALRRASIAGAALAGRHRLLVCLLGVGALFRLLVTVAYRPALFYTGDTYTYLHAAQTLEPDPQRPILYSLFLRPLLETGVLTLVPLVQHALGLAVAIVVYALVRRTTGPAWLGCLAAGPVVLDGLQVTLEHYLLTETLFQALVVGALALAVWWTRPSPLAAGAAGLLLAAATLTRTVGLVLVVPVLAVLVWRRVRPLALAALVAAFAVPLLGYAAWFESHWGRFHLTAYEGYFLYGRVGSFVDCSGLAVSPEARPLCRAERLQDQRPAWYVFAPDSPVHIVRPASGHDVNQVAGAFARDMIGHRPRAYVRAVAGDLVGYFRMHRTASPLQGPIEESQLPPDRVSYYDPARAHAAIAAVGQPDDVPVVERGLARRLADWQGSTWIPGPLLALAALVALAAPLYGPRSRGDPIGATAGVLFAACGLVLLVAPSAAATFDWRFVVPSLPLFGVGGALGLQELLRALPERG